MLKAFQDLIDLAKASVKTMPRDDEGKPQDRTAHLRSAFQPRPKFKVDKKRQRTTASQSTEKPKFTVRDLGRQLSQARA